MLPEFEYFYCILGKEKLYFYNEMIKSYRLCSFNFKLFSLFLLRTVVVVLLSYWVTV